MSKMDKAKKILKQEKEIIGNVFGAFAVKGASMLLSLFSTPAYLKFFGDDVVLGIWFTMLSILNWIIMCDFGIGNGLRNKLAVSLVQKNDCESREYISSAYISISFIIAGLCVVLLAFQPFMDWNSILNVSTDSISASVLKHSMNVIIVGVLIRMVLGLINAILYAMQLSAINNALTFATSLLIYLFLMFARGEDAETNLISLSYVHVLFSNLPLVVATIVVFLKPLKNMRPKLKAFRKEKAREILNIGVILLWLQVVAMVVMSTHAFFITRMAGPADVVDYNLYYKIYITVASIVSLAITPIWSAVTKAQEEKRYSWIKKLYYILIEMSGVVLLGDLAIMPFLQKVFDIWLGDSSIPVTVPCMIVMTLFNTLYVLHNVNTSINNGLSYFKVQNILMTVAAVLMVPACAVMTKLTGDWTGVIWGCCIALIPYEFMQPFFTIKKLNVLEREER